MHIGDTFRFNSKGSCCGTPFSVLASFEKVDNAVGPYAPYAWKSENGVTYALARNGDHALEYVCKCCGKARYARPVLGKFNARKVCSSKCMASIGFQCECQCGGKNHGASHG